MDAQSDFLTVLPDRTIISITGPEAKSFLQRVITNGPVQVKSQDAQFSALLTPQGKVLADFFIFDHDDNEGLWIDIPTAEQDSLLKRFNLYRMRAEADIKLCDDLQLGVARGEGQLELETIAQAISPDPRQAALGVRAIVPAGGPAADSAKYHTARIALGIPEFGSDYGSAKVFSTDINHDLMNGIDYKKGCFVGQEVASRMIRKGGVRKRTVLIKCEGTLSKGDNLMAADRPIGIITSAQQNSALALMRMDHLDESRSENIPISVNQHSVVFENTLGIFDDRV